VSETGRIRFLIERDGEASARAWALDTARTYRRVVLRRHPRWRKPGETHATHTLYRRGLIQSYVALKAFALGDRAEGQEGK